MMRIGLDITVLNDQQKTGIAVYTYYLIEALLKQDKKDKFVLFGISTFSTYDYLRGLPFKNFPNVEIKIIKLPAKLFRSFFLTWQRLNWPTIENIIGRVDIFHSFNFYLPPQKSGKIVATVFDMTPLMFPRWHLEKTIQLEKIRLNRIAKYSDLVITISENSKKDFLKKYPTSRVEVIYPGLSGVFHSKIIRGKIDKVLDKYKLKPGYILSVGTLEPRKNIESLVNAYLQSNLKNPLVIVGRSGWKNEPLVNLVNNHKNIRLLGFVPDEDLPIIYSQAIFLVYPSFYEGFGLPALEAMAVSCPVITSNSSSLKEVLGEASLYIDPNNIESITGAMQRLYSDQSLRGELIKKGLLQAKKFSWEKSAKRLVSLYRSLVKSKAK